MAAYREHISFSTFFGICTGTAAYFLGFNPVQSVLAGCLTGIGGILPDLDSESGKPVREVFGLTAAMAPLLMIHRLREWGGGDMDNVVLLAILIYITIRYGASVFLGIVSVHRGMFHSLPAMFIAGEVTFLAYKSNFPAVKTLMGISVMLGFVSHLILDEIYAVEWDGMKVKLNKFAGSAMKWVGKSWPANIVTYGLLFTLTFGILTEEGFVATEIPTLPLQVDRVEESDPMMSFPRSPRRIAPEPETVRPISPARVTTRPSTQPDVPRLPY